MSLPFDTRVGAYGVLVEDGLILLAHWHASDQWTLPGGGLEVGEDPPAAAVREFREETGYEIELLNLLGLSSVHVPSGRRLDGLKRPLHSLQVIYEARRVGGSLASEIDGSTDEARWFELADLPELPRVELVDRGLALWLKNRGRGTPAESY